MVTQEEIRGKLSLDTSALGKAKRDIQDFSEHGHSGFVHVGSQARGFHKLLHKITEESPLLGTALTAALSPINAAFIAAGLAITYFNRKLEEWNAEMDKAEARNSKAIFGEDAIRASAVEAHKMATEHQRFMDMREDASKQFMDALEHEQQTLRDNLEIEQARLKLSKEMAGELIRQQVSRGTMSMAGGMALMGQLNQHTNDREKENQMLAFSARLVALQRGAGSALEEYGNAKQSTGDIEGKREAIATKIARRKAIFESLESDSKPLEEASANARGVLPGLLATAANGWSTEKGLKEQAEAIRQADAARDKNKQQLKVEKEALAQLKEEQDNLNSSYGESKEKVAKWHSALTTISQEQSKIIQEADKVAKTPSASSVPMSLSSPNEFSTSELANYNTWFGRVAREIESRKRWSKFYSAAGRDDLARQVNKSIDPSGGKDSLYGLLPEGMTSEQNAARQQQSMIGNILAALGASPSEGVPVSVRSIPNGG